MFHNRLPSRGLRTFVVMMLVIATSLLLPSAAYAAFFTIIIGDGAVDTRWSEPFIWDNPNDNGGNGDIEHAYFAANWRTPTAFSFRLHGEDMSAGSPLSIQAGMDCNTNGSFGDAVDRFVLPGLGEVFDGAGQSVGVFNIQMEYIGATDIEWTASSTASNWGECTSGLIYVKFYGPSGDTTLSRGYSVATGAPVTQASPNYASGAAGSYINLTGNGYPPNQTGTLTINGQAAGDIQTDGNGEFVVTLSTANADEGVYVIVASVNSGAAARFVVDNDAGIWPREGSYPVFDVPAGIAFTHEIHLPLIQR